MDCATDLFYGNTLAVIKLHKNKIMANVPNGVFTCILEYQFPKVLLWRYSDPYAQIMHKQDRHFPAIDNLHYENYLIAVNKIDEYAEF